MIRIVALFILCAILIWIFPGYATDALLLVANAIVWIFRFIAYAILATFIAIFAGLQCLVGDPFKYACQAFHQQQWVFFGVLVCPIVLLVLKFLARNADKLLLLPQKIIYAFFYIFTPHPATKVVKRSAGEISDHAALTEALTPPTLDEAATPPSPLRSSVLRRKAEALTELIKRRQAERGLLKEHEDFVRREHRRKKREQ